MSQATVEANKELVRDYIDVLENKELDRVPEFYADDLSVDLMDRDEGDSEEGGVQELVEQYEETMEAFPDATIDLKEMAAEGDWVMYRLMIEATHEGTFKGIEPTGKDVTYQVHNSRRVEDGEFVEVHGTASMTWLLSQLDVDLPIEE